MEPMEFMMLFANTTCHDDKVCYFLLHDHACGPTLEPEMPVDQETIHVRQPVFKECWSTMRGIYKLLRLSRKQKMGGVPSDFTLIACRWYHIVYNLTPLGSLETANTSHGAFVPPLSNFTENRTVMNTGGADHRNHYGLLQAQSA